MAWLPASRHTANRQGIECRDRIGLRPQPHATCVEARVAVVEIELAMEPCPHAIAHGHGADAVPLPQRRCLDARARPLSTSSVVVVLPDIVLERVGADDVVLPVIETENDAARGDEQRPHEAPPVTPRMVRSLNAVIESAFVHSPTRPDLKRESRWSSSKAPSSQPWMWSPTATTRSRCH